MKLWYSFKKELILATRSFYFYIELMFAVVILAVLLWAVPEQIRVVQTQYLMIDLPQQMRDILIDRLLEEDIDGLAEPVSIDTAEEKIDARLIETETEHIYLLDSKEQVRSLSDQNRKLGFVVSLDQKNELHYTYYLQGYETKRFKNLIAVLNLTDIDETSLDSQTVQYLNTGGQPLNDRENTIPAVITFNSCFMGMFIMAAYVFLDKQEGVISAFAVTASSVRQYMLSKILVVLLTAAVSGLIVTIPVMGSRMNYPAALTLLLTSGFFSSVLGLLVASFFKDITKAFGTIFFVLILLMVPVVSYFLPDWNPVWVTLIPSGFVIQAFKDMMTGARNQLYTWIVTIGFLLAGLVLFVWTDKRYREQL